MIQILTILFRVTVVCLILAYKYYCETQDIVVNIDVCRLMGIRGASSQSLSEGADRLMNMELTMLDILDFDLHVSISEYNKA